MDAEISPEPTDEERRAILAALAVESGPPPVYRSAWRLAALDELSGDTLAEDAGGDAGVVEP